MVANVANVVVWGQRVANSLYKLHILRNYLPFYPFFFFVSLWLPSTTL